MTEYEDIQEPYFRFDEPGTKLEGTYVRDLGPSDTYPFNNHVLKEANTGKETKFHGNKQLDALLSQIQEGDYIIVTFIEEIPTKFVSPMKRFSVQRRVGGNTQNDRLPSGLF